MRNHLPKAFPGTASSEDPSMIIFSHDDMALLKPLLVSATTLYSCETSRASVRHHECSIKPAQICKAVVNQTAKEEAMKFGRRELISPMLAIGLLGVVPAFAGADEDAVAKSVEAFRIAQAAANAETLAALCAAELSYSHSDGHVEDKATFIANATNGKAKWLSLEYRDPKIRVVGPAAIVRFNWVGESEAIADGRKSSTNLHVLMNWQKQGESWKLLSRAATKL
jgi:hypothetical protein